MQDFFFVWSRSVCVFTHTHLVDIFVERGPRARSNWVPFETWRAQVTATSVQISSGDDQPHMSGM